MRFRFVWIGKTKNKEWSALQDDYLQRLSHFVKFEITEIKESQPHETKETEAGRIMSTLTTSDFIVLLDVTGREQTSHELANKIKKWQIQSIKEIIFIIGGQDGVTNEIQKRADVKLALSLMTFTHEMARVLLAEQLYRAFTIINNHPYQK